MQATKNQVSQQVLKVQSSVRQLSAAKEVSELEYELAQSNLNEVQIRLNAGGATVVVITHDRDIAASFPRQVEMLDGRIVMDGRP